MPRVKGKKKWVWSREEARLVQTLAEHGYAARRTAKAIGCTQRELMYRFARLFPKASGGRDANSFTKKEHDQVRAMASYGIPEDQIALVMDTTVPTLRKHFDHELKTASPNANALVAGFLFNQARQGSTPAAQFWLRCRAGWKDKQHLVHEGNFGVLVAPSGADPQNWIETERQRTSKESTASSNGDD